MSSLVPGFDTLDLEPKINIGDPVPLSPMPSFDDLLKGREWIDAKVRPPEPGLIVKRWKKPHGYSHWAGYFNGDPKMASCDFWLSLPE